MRNFNKIVWVALTLLTVGVFVESRAILSNEDWTIVLTWFTLVTVCIIFANLTNNYIMGKYKSRLHEDAHSMSLREFLYHNPDQTEETYHSLRNSLTND